jgi:hypothetical protein
MNPRFSIFGILLIIIGSFLLLRQFHVIELRWNIFLWGILTLWSGEMFIRGFIKNENGKVFFGTALFLLALYNLLRSLDFIEVHFHTFISILFIILGFSFLMLALTEPRSMLPLIPGFFLGGIGTLLLLEDYGYIDSWNVWNFARTYWPVVLIAFGVAMILKRRQ